MSFTTIIGLIPQAISLITSIIGLVRSNQERGLGRAEAIAEALTIAKAQVDAAAQARAEAQAEHAKHPDSDDAFLREFERKG